MFPVVAADAAIVAALILRSCFCSEQRCRVGGAFLVPSNELVRNAFLFFAFCTAPGRSTAYRRPSSAVQAALMRVHVLNIAGARGARYSLLPPESATGNCVKVVQRIPVKIVFERGQDPDHLLRPAMSVEPEVKVR